MPLSLHYDFVNDRSLTARLGPTLSITRATAASYLGADGYIAEASSGEARFPFDVNGDSQGLLVEEARTNICLQSEDLSTTWANVDCTDTPDQAIAPDGSLAADLVTNTHASNPGRMVQNFASTAAQYTFSAYLKAGSSSTAKFGLVDQGLKVVTVEVDLSAGTLGTEAGSPDNTTIEDIGNGWYRVSLTYTFPAVGAADTMDIQNIGSNGSAIYVWGAQMELGAFPTSYIPTTTGTVTRNADYISGDGSLADNPQGTLFGSGLVEYDRPSGSGALVSLNASNSSEDAAIVRQTPYNVLVDIRAASTLQSFVGPAGDNDITAGTAFNSAMAWSSNDAIIYVDGAASTQDTSVTVPSGITDLDVGHRFAVQNEWNGLIKEIAYWDERLPNATLEGLSDGSIGIGGPRNYIAVTRRTASQMRPKQRMPKPTRGLFRD